MRFPVFLVLIVTVLSACQTSSEHDDTAALNGVWRTVVSDSNSHESMQALVLDGLMLSVSSNGQKAHSGELVMDNGQVSGLFARRDAQGERDRDYTVLGEAYPGDQLEADLLGSHGNAALSMFFDATKTYSGGDYRNISGLYYLDAPQLQISLSIDQYGVLQGYDDAGCGYFGQVSIPNRRDNLYEVALEVEGCAIAGDYGYGLASVRFDAQGWPELVLPIWFDEQDRVEPWVLQRV